MQRTLSKEAASQRALKNIFNEIKKVRLWLYLESRRPDLEVLADVIGVEHCVHAALLWGRLQRVRIRTVGDKDCKLEVITKVKL